MESANIAAPLSRLGSIIEARTGSNLHSVIQSELHCIPANLDIHIIGFEYAEEILVCKLLQSHRCIFLGFGSPGELVVISYLPFNPPQMILQGKVAVVGKSLSPLGDNHLFLLESQV